MVTKHLTKAKFGMEFFKFFLCLSIPGMAVLVFRVRVCMRVLPSLWLIGIMLPVLHVK